MGGTTDMHGQGPWLRGWRYLGSPGPGAWLLSVRQEQVPLGQSFLLWGKQGQFPRISQQGPASGTPGRQREARQHTRQHSEVPYTGATLSRAVPLSPDPAARWLANPIQSCCWTDSNKYTQRKQKKEH